MGFGVGWTVQELSSHRWAMLKSPLSVAANIRSDKLSLARVAITLPYRGICDESPGYLAPRTAAGRPGGGEGPDWVRMM